MLSEALTDDTREFVVGVNLPWLSYGQDFGRNAWRSEGGLARSDRRQELDALLATFAERGLQLVRWFVLCDGRAGIRWDRRGAPLGIDGCFFTDFDLALALIEKHGLVLMPVLLDFHWFRPARTHDRVKMGGRRNVVANPLLLAELLERIIVPILERYGSSPHVAAWDVINEPEWATLGYGGAKTRGAVRPEDMRGLISGAVERIHAVTLHPATVGCASASGLPLVADLGSDFYEVHWYDSVERLAPLTRPVADLGLDHPVILGEFPTKGSQLSTDSILNAARQAGFRGALAWSAMAHDKASDFIRGRIEIAGWMARTERVV